MNNSQILDIIENLKGRRGYEEKKAAKLGFSSLYAYIEDKIIREKEKIKAEIIEKSLNKEKESVTKKEAKKSSCSCC
tara:strand:- start:323 stop:553 length:231 start_codon:yes stop_codon:yes gene_type:complete